MNDVKLHVALLYHDGLLISRQDLGRFFKHGWIRGFRGSMFVRAFSEHESPNPEYSCPHPQTTVFIHDCGNYALFHMQFAVCGVRRRFYSEPGWKQRVCLSAIHGLGPLRSWKTIVELVVPNLLMRSVSVWPVFLKHTFFLNKLRDPKA